MRSSSRRFQLFHADTPSSNKNRLTSVTFPVDSKGHRGFFCRMICSSKIDPGDKTNGPAEIKSPSSGLVHSSNSASAAVTMSTGNAFICGREVTVKKALVGATRVNSTVRGLGAFTPITVKSAFETISSELTASQPAIRKSGIGSGISVAGSQPRRTANTISSANTGRIASTPVISTLPGKIGTRLVEAIGRTQ